MFRSPKLIMLNGLLIYHNTLLICSTKNALLKFLLKKQQNLKRDSGLF